MQLNRYFKRDYFPPDGVTSRNNPPHEPSRRSAKPANIDAELAALEQRRDKTRALKQAMIQELLTGKTRLV